MSDEHTQDGGEQDQMISRRDAIKTGSAIGATALVSKFATPAEIVAAQTTEPRLQLGDDWAIDDDSDGSGNNDLRLEHQPTGAELRYDVSAGAWKPTAEVDMGGNPVSNVSDLSAGSVSTGKAGVTNETLIKPTRTSDSASTSAGTPINIFDDENEDKLNEFNSGQFSPEETGDYAILAYVDMRGNTTDGDNIRCKIQNVTDGTKASVFIQYSIATFGALQPLMWDLELDSAKTYEIQAENRDSSFVISKFNTAGKITRGLIR